VIPIISLILFGVLLIIKIGIHIFLDTRHGHKIYASFVASSTYLLPYNREVSSEYKNLKSICNKIQLLAIGVLFFTIISFIAKDFLKHST
jgi:hypothetical protein